MLCSKFYRKNISIWQHLSFILSEIMVLGTVFVLVLQSIDINSNVFHYGTFMFDYLDVYSNVHSLIIFNFGVMISSMVPECVGFNITITIISVLICIVLGYFSLYIYKLKAKPILITWVIIIIAESLFSFAFTNFPWVFILYLSFRLFFLFCVIMSIRHVNNNYEYYDV